MSYWPDHREPFTVRRVNRLLVATVCALLPIGCWDDTPVAKQPPNAVATPLASASEAAVSEIGGADAQSEQLSAEDSSPNSQDESSARESPDRAAGGGTLATEEVRPETPPERLAVLTPGGPVLIDWRFTLDGQAHDQPLTEILAQVMQAADANEDGRATWEELKANRDFLEGPLVGLPADDQRQPPMWIEQFDYNDDGRLQRDEATAWLGRGTGRSARALALRSSRSGYADPRWTSRIWQLLDQDRSGDLSSGEVQRAPKALRSRDEDDNQIITQAELAALVDQLEAATPAMASRQSGDGRNAALWIADPPDVDRLDYLLVNLYAPRQFLGPDSFPNLSSLFDQLDTNGNQWLAKAELAGLATVESHLAIDVEFPAAELPASDEHASPTTRFHVRQCADELDLLAQSDDRLDFALGGVRLVLFVQDFAAAAGEGAPVQRSQIDLMVHDQCDALFETLDANADGRLGDREMTHCAARLLEADASGDGRLVPGELPHLMVIAASRAEPTQPGGFYVPRVNGGTKTTDAPHWFVSGDFNGDGDLSRREFLGDAKQFAELDSNGDGFVDVAEATAFAADEQ